MAYTSPGQGRTVIAHFSHARFWPTRTPRRFTPSITTCLLRHGLPLLRCLRPLDQLATPRGLLRAITQLQRMGLLFLRDVPSTDTSDANCKVRKLGARFAEVRDTFYGDVWNVKTRDESRNIAYTSLSSSVRTTSTASL